MEIEFDSEKDDLNRRKNGISLADAALMDFETALVVSDQRRPYGEDRFRASGLTQGRLHVLAFTMRGDKLRAISLRRANSRERKHYEQRQR